MNFVLFFFMQKSIHLMADLQAFIDRLGVFKRNRPKTAQQARRFFYCKWAKKDEVCFLSGSACAQRHKKAKKKLEALAEANAPPVEYEISGCRACGECEFGAIRVKLLKNKGKKHE